MYINICTLEIQKSSSTCKEDKSTCRKKQKQITKDYGTTLSNVTIMA